MSAQALYDFCLSNNVMAAMNEALAGASFTAAPDANDQTALHLAACPVLMVPVVQLAVDRGTDVNIRTKDGRTPLYYAARFGNVAACKALLAGGAKNLAANFGKTPLQRAEEEGHANVVQMLKGSLKGDRERLASVASRLADVMEDVLHVLAPGAQKPVSLLVVLKGSSNDQVCGVLELYKKTGAVNKKFDKVKSMPAHRIKLDQVENLELAKIVRSKTWDCFKIRSQKGETILYGKPMARLDEWVTAVKKHMGTQQLSFITSSGGRLPPPPPMSL